MLLLNMIRNLIRSLNETESVGCVWEDPSTRPFRILYAISLFTAIFVLLTSFSTCGPSRPEFRACPPPCPGPPCPGPSWSLGWGDEQKEISENNRKLILWCKIMQKVKARLHTSWNITTLQGSPNFFFFFYMRATLKNWSYTVLYSLQSKIQEHFKFTLIAWQMYVPYPYVSNSMSKWRKTLLFFTDCCFFLTNIFCFPRFSFYGPNLRWVHSLFATVNEMNGTGWSLLERCNVECIVESFKRSAVRLALKLDFLIWTGLLTPLNSWVVASNSNRIYLIGSWCDQCWRGGCLF